VEIDYDYIVDMVDMAVDMAAEKADFVDKAVDRNYPVADYIDSAVDC
jgi:hypothetical protein